MTEANAKNDFMVDEFYAIVFAFDSDSNSNGVTRPTICTVYDYNSDYAPTACYVLLF